MNQMQKKVKLLNHEIRTKNIMIRLAIIVTIFFLICFGALSLARAYSGNFEIDLNNGRRTLSLSENENFNEPTDLLKVKIPKDINNISYTTLPFDTLGTVDGDMSGKNYLAYTFYLKNTGDKSLQYESSLKILGYEKGLDECIRVMITLNDESISYYAKKSINNLPEQVYYYDDHALFDEVIITEPFKDDKKVFEKLENRIEPGIINKYNIVIWIEGSDPETVNEKLSGAIRLKWDFRVILDEGDINEEN